MMDYDETRELWRGILFGLVFVFACYVGIILVGLAFATILGY